MSDANPSKAMYVEGYTKSIFDGIWMSYRISVSLYIAIAIFTYMKMWLLKFSQCLSIRSKNQYKCKTDVNAYQSDKCRIFFNIIKNHQFKYSRQQFGRMNMRASQLQNEITQTRTNKNKCKSMVKAFYDDSHPILHFHMNVVMIFWNLNIKERKQNESQIHYAYKNSAKRNIVWYAKK